MTNQETEVSYESPSPPYANPLTILAPNDSIIDPVPSVVPSQSSLEKCIPSFLFPVLFLYMIVQIVIGCFNCSLPASNLGWIRASFFLNIPSVLLLCSYFIRQFRARKFPTFTDFYFTLVMYNLFFALYLLDLGIYFEAIELNMIQNALGNATVIDSLPCSTDFYKNVFGLKMSQYFLIIFSAFIVCLFSCCKVPLTNGKDLIKERCTPFIINQWRYFTGIICQRHQGEIHIERY